MLRWLQVRGLLVEMIIGGVSLEIVDELRSVATATSISDRSLHSLLTDALTSAVTTLRLVSCWCCCHQYHLITLQVSCWLLYYYYHLLSDT